MLTRFRLYGFLKSLRVHESFLLLALLDRGQAFTAIGGLIAVREVTVAVLEVPTGAIADSLGRRRCMVASMLAYVVSGIALAFASGWWWFALAMSLQGVGDAFRSGTHKALIHAWMRANGRLDERTRIYGSTRSWSQLGAATSALFGGALLVVGADYRAMFLASAAIAAVNLVNLATYPPALDERDEADAEPSGTVRRLRDALADVVRPGRLRSLLSTSMVVQGAYVAAKQYLQPVLQAIALALPFALGLDEAGRTGLVVGVVSSVLYVVASVASKRAHVVERRFAGPDAGARALERRMVWTYAAIGVGAWFGLAWLSVACFVLLAAWTNLWRPVQVGRIGIASDARRTATVLSIESQARALAAAVFAPAIGALVDLLRDGARPAPLHALAPFALLAIPIALRCFRGSIETPQPRDVVGIDT